MSRLATLAALLVTAAALQTCAIPAPKAKPEKSK